MFVSETGFYVNQVVDTYTFSNQDATIPIQIFNVSDQCTPDQTVLSECLSKTAIVDTIQSFTGNVLYVLIPEVSLTKYSVAPDTYITISEEGQIMVQISPGSEPEITDLSTQAEQNISIGSSTSTTEPNTSASLIQVEPDTLTSLPPEHEIVVAFNIAKGIADSIRLSNSSGSTATTASMTPSTLSSFNPWSKFG